MPANETHLPVDWDQILSTTLHNYRATLTDNVFEGRPLLNFLKRKNRLRVLSGGYSIVEPIIYEEGQAGVYSQWDQLAITPQEGISAAQFPWKQAYATIAISGLEEAQNSGKEQVINLLEAKTMQAEQTFQALFNRMAWGTAAASPNNWTPLTDLIDSTTVAGGIDPADPGNGFWASYEAAVGAVDGVGLERAFSTAVLTSSDSGSDMVDAMFTDMGTFQFYESTLQPQLRYTDVETANLGFSNLLYKQVPIMWDNEAPAGVVLGINSKYVGMVVHSARNFRTSGFSKGLAGNMASGHATNGTGQTVDARYAVITTYGNFTIRQRRRCFKLTGITEAP